MGTVTSTAKTSKPNAKAKAQAKPKANTKAKAQAKPKASAEVACVSIIGQPPKTLRGMQAKAWRIMQAMNGCSMAKLHEALCVIPTCNAGRELGFERLAELFAEHGETAFCKGKYNGAPMGWKGNKYLKGTFEVTTAKPTKAPSMAVLAKQVAE